MATLETSYLSKPWDNSQNRSQIQVAQISTPTVYWNRFVLSDYILMETIGLGSYGRVRVCKNKKTNKIYAIKILKKGEIIRMKQIDHWYSEFNILTLIYHPFIVELKGVNFSDGYYLFFLMEFVPGGEVFTWLRKNKSFPFEQVQFYTAHIVSIFFYLHSKSIIYRDWKPENILIGLDGYLKWTDFGFAKQWDSSSLTYTLCGTPEYLAPEIITNKGHSFPADWWTLGVWLYEMSTGDVPFNDNDPMKIYQKILKGKVNYPNDLNKEAKSLIKHLLVINVAKRYGCLKNRVKDIFDHKMFKGFNWKGLLLKTIRAPYLPKVWNNADTKNFNIYPDSDNEELPLKQEKDPFINW